MAYYFYSNQTLKHYQSNCALLLRFILNIANLASSVLLYKKDSACWWASPNPPRTVLRTDCAPDGSGTFHSHHFTANKKEGRQQPHDCHLPANHRCFLILFSPAVSSALHQFSGTDRCPVLRSGNSSFPSSPRGTPHRVFSSPQGCCRTRMTNPLRAEVS